MPRHEPQLFTLDEALRYAVDHYPTDQAAVEQVNASTAGVSVAKAGYLPRLDSLWQSNRGTQQRLRPGAAAVGHPGDVRTGAAVRVQPERLGQRHGALFSWEPFDFGLRDATVAAPKRRSSRARADEALTRLDVQSAVGAAFLASSPPNRRSPRRRPTWSAGTCSRRAAHTLADNQLRPGAEASRADAERAAAQTRSIQARQALVLAQMTLARVLGVTAGTVAMNAREPARRRFRRGDAAE